MKQRSQALLALGILAASRAAAAVAEPPLKTLPSQQDIWITGTMQRGHGQYAPVRAGRLYVAPAGPSVNLAV